MFQEWVPDDHVSVTRNESYWQTDEAGAALPYLESIEFRPLADLRIRRAIVMGINSEAINQTLFDGVFEQRDNPYPTDHNWYTETDYPTFDPDAAKALVDEYVAENGDPSLEIMIVDVGNAAVVAQQLQEMFEGIGIETTIEALDQTAYIGRFVTGDFDSVYIVGYFGDADPDQPVQLNFPHHRSDAVDEAIAANRATDDPAARKQAWETIHRTWAEDLPYAYMLATDFAMVTTAEVHGLAEPVSPSGADLPAINRWVPYWTGVWVG